MQQSECRETYKHSKGFAVPAAGIMMMQTTLVLSISENGQVIGEILELCMKHQYSHKNLQNAILNRI